MRSITRQTKEQSFENMNNIEPSPIYNDYRRPKPNSCPPKHYSLAKDRAPMPQQKILPPPVYCVENMRRIESALITPPKKNTRTTPQELGSNEIKSATR